MSDLLTSNRVPAVPWPLVGRTVELASARDSLRRPGCAGVLLAGAAGVGRTRLALAVLEAEHAAGRRVAWMVATEGGRTVPFGAVGTVVDLERIAARPDDAAGFVSAALAELGGDVVLGIDDAHLLDDSSALLVQQAALRGNARVVLTTEGGAHAPGPISSLWRDGAVDRIDLASVQEDTLGAVLEAALGGPVDSATRRRLWEVTRGDLMFLRHVLADGDVDLVGGVWRWTPPATPGPRVREVVSARVGRLDEEELRVARLVALGAPLALTVVHHLASRAAAQRLEDRCVTRVVQSERGPEMELAHPMFGEVIRAGTPNGTARSLLVELVAAHEERATYRSPTAMRLAEWYTDADVRAPRDLLVAGAGEALQAGDWPVAARLATLALAAGDEPFASAVALGTARNAQGRVTEAIAVLPSVHEHAPTDGLRAAAASEWAFALHWGQGRTDDALAVIANAADLVIGDDVRQAIGALRVDVLVSSGRARDVLASTDGLDRTRPQVAAAVARALFAAGRAADAPVGGGDLATLTLERGRLAFRGEISRLHVPRSSTPPPCCEQRILEVSSPARSRSSRRCARKAVTPGWRSLPHSKRSASAVLACIRTTSRSPPARRGPRGRPARAIRPRPPRWMTRIAAAEANGALGGRGARGARGCSSRRC